MQPSRRRTLRGLGIALVPATVGCLGTPGTGAESTDSTPTATSETSSGGATFLVALVGPEGRTRLFDAGDVASAGEVREGPLDRYFVPITPTESATDAVTETFRTRGVREWPDEFEVVQTYDGEVVGWFNIAPGLAEAIAGGEWGGSFRLTFAEREQARDVRAALVAASG